MAESSNKPPTQAEIAKTKVDHDRLIADAIDAQRKASPAAGQKLRANYGPFADHPARFVVAHEAVGQHPVGSEVGYRELAVFHGKAGGGPDYNNIDAIATKENVERLLALGAIEKKKLIIEVG